MAYVVTGRKDTGETHPRLEIRDLQRNPEQFVLFVLGLRAVQYPKKPIDDIPGLQGFTASTFLPPGGDWFSIGGVHGAPYERWPGDPAIGILGEKANQEEIKRSGGQPQDAISERPTSVRSQNADEDPLPGDETARFGGYCNHASVHFPPWHRPYLLALEQSIGIAATEIAKKLIQDGGSHNAATWTQAAKQLRFPFWDWTLPDTFISGLPEIFKDQRLEGLKLPNGKKVSIPNPLAYYEFREHMGTERMKAFVDFSSPIPYTGDPPKVPRDQEIAYFKSWDRTCRWPEESPEANDNYKTLNYHLRRLYPELLTKVAHLFTFGEEGKEMWPRIWDEFSNTWMKSDPNHDTKAIVYRCLEAVHNSLHLIIGGVGHMGQNEFAAFDPIFYLHHCNVDRIYAFWEHVYPKYKMGFGYKDGNELKFFTQPQGTYLQLVETRLDDWTDMLPWRKTIDAYWTPTDAASLEVKEGVWPKYYTYPPIGGVRLETAISPDADRIALRKGLQVNFGSDFTAARGEVERLRSHLFDTSHHRARDGRTLIPNYRHFAFAVELREHIYNDSFSLEITYTDGREEDPNHPQSPDDVFYGHVAVLSRPLGTSCAGCRGRRAVGSTVHGMIHVPSKYFANFLGWRNTNATPTVAEEVALCKTRFHARLIGRGGVVFAHTEPNPVSDEKRRLPQEDTPSVKLCAAFAEVIGGHVELSDWETLGEVFTENNWATGPENSVWAAY